MYDIEIKEKLSLWGNKQGKVEYELITIIIHNEQNPANKTKVVASFRLARRNKKEVVYSLVCVGPKVWKLEG